MRALILVPILLIVAVAAGFLVCGALSVDPHAKELLSAALTCLLAGELAAIPLILTRGATQASVTQAALIGTVLHLFVSISIAGVVILGKVGLGPTFLYWLLGLY